MTNDFTDFFSDLNSMVENFGKPSQDNDDGYREWSETIEKQNQEFQDWESVQGVRFTMDIDEVMSIYHGYYA